MAATMTSPKIVFVCGGEGTTATAPETCLALAKASPTWALCLGALRKAGIEAPGAFVEGALGTHVAPGSPVATTVLNLCLADTWKAWGYEPSISVGHSVGEVAAAYAAGMYTVEEAMAVALELGEAAKKTSEGRMLHTRVAKGDVAELRKGARDGCALSAVNGVDAVSASVSLCGPVDKIDSWLSKDAGAKKLKPAHAWHHKDLFAEASSELFEAKPAPKGLKPSKACAFVSATTGGEVFDELDEAHWRDWLCSPVEFVDALETVGALAEDAPKVTVRAGHG